jgi:peptidoglycan L-alanyl-D-glutamate endopeptidase CwlK
MSLGRASKLKLATCHPELQLIISEAAAGVDAGDLVWAGIHDITVAFGYRGKEEQDAAVARGASKAPWPTSKHNRVPSDAADVLPYPEMWADDTKCRILHGYIRGIAQARGVALHSISWDPAHIQRRVK